VSPLALGRHLRLTVEPTADAAIVLVRWAFELDNGRNPAQRYGLNPQPMPREFWGVLRWVLEHGFPMLGWRVTVDDPTAPPASEAPRAAPPPASPALPPRRPHRNGAPRV
jgi:hypothetical protein